jgi:REP-associated tyrosine transposase
MPHRFQISHDSQALFLTVVTKNRLTVFRKDELKEVVCRALDEARKSASFLLFAYVIMLDHTPADKPTSTSDVLRVVKSLTARRVIDYLKAREFFSSLAKLEHAEREQGYKYSLWQTEKNVLSIFSEQKFMEKVNYIHQNPVKAGLVERAVDYRWSSARIWHGCPLEDEPLLVDKDLILWRKGKP